MIDFIFTVVGGLFKSVLYIGMLGVACYVLIAVLNQITNDSK